MMAGGRLSTIALATGALLAGGVLLASKPVLAQANGDPGSALLGISRAQTHSEAKGKSNANPEGYPANADAHPGNPPQDPTRAAANNVHHN